MVEIEGRGLPLVVCRIHEFTRRISHSLEVTVCCGFDNFDTPSHHVTTRGRVDDTDPAPPI